MNEIIDLCAGCGGFSLGAELAGFHTSIAVEKDPDLFWSFDKNFPHTKTVLQDISTLDRAAWRLLKGNHRPAGVIGGPPCQGFSQIGKRNPTDPRNDVVIEFMRQVEILDPLFFVMENVDGLLQRSHSRVLHEALDLVPSKYRTVGPLILEASEYGAATKRRRIVVIGYDPEYVADVHADDLIAARSETTVTVSDAISDLPTPDDETPTQTRDFLWASYPRHDELSDYARRMRNAPSSDIGWGQSVDKLKKGLVSGITGTKHTVQVQDRFAATAPGDVEPVSWYPRLAWDGLSPALRAGTGKDRGSFQSMRPIHPSEPRVITVREAARLQGFPDWFVFHPTKWHSFRMIGNSVSPCMGKAVFDILRDRLDVRVAA